MNFNKSKAFAIQMDNDDPLHHFRNHFYYPEMEGIPSIYLCGNSLGLQPRQVHTYVNEELEIWKNIGVKGHFESSRPWATYHELLQEPLASLTGAFPSEVVAMNSLTVNLHLLLVSFYQPTSTRYKILMEAGAFPSDQYAIESQIRFHGFDPDEAIIEVAPGKGEHIIRNEEIINIIEERQEEIALVLLAGVQYYSGQLFDLQKIAKSARKAGIIIGYDLAHAIGNVPLQLHEWQVDFAVWCSYKYLNAGPGAIAGAFIHQKHEKRQDLPRFAGWWGYQEKERFNMKKGFKPAEGADGWQLSNPDILSLASLRASLSLFEEATVGALREKSIRLTGYLEYLLHKINNDYGSEFIKIITPDKAEERGCQLSLIFKKGGKEILFELQQNQVIVDWREPDVLRVAPVPLYNSFQEVFNFYEILERCIKES
ncbi:kynureninase [soil metagenome]